MNLNQNDSVAIAEGYSNNYIHLYFVKYRYIHYRELPDYAKKFFEDEKESDIFIDIELSDKKVWGIKNDRSNHI